MYNLKLVFNRGLGALPVSLEVSLQNSISIDNLEQIYSDITKYGSPDILFVGAISENVPLLLWLVPRLKNEGAFVSVMSLPYVGLNPHGYIVPIFKVDSSLVSLITGLTENDILLFKGDDPNLLNRLRNLVIKHKVDCKLMFDSAVLKAKDVLDKGIIDVHPY